MTFRLGRQYRLEPLVFGWPAWWCNVAPVTAAFHAHRMQLPFLRSYLKHPAAHVRAANDPRLAGASFVNVPVERVDAVRTLLEAMQEEYAEGSAFTEAWLDFGERLRQAAVGQTMEPFYGELPPGLAGLVELGYDYENRPSMRLDEGLAYESSLYRPERQEVVLRRGAVDDKRPFYASTPVLGADGLRAKTPFDSDALADLVDTDVRPVDATTFAERLAAVFPSAGGSAADFSEEVGARAEPSWNEAQIRVRYIGHACVLVQYKGKSVLLDPVVPQGEHGGGVFGFESLPERIDYALITHAHPDHFDVETLVRLRPRVDRILVPRHSGYLVGDVSLRRVLRKLRYQDIVEVDSMNRFPLPDGELVVLPFLGEHGDILHGSKAAYYLRFGATSMLFAADSTCLDPALYRRARSILGRIDHVFMNTEIDGAPISWPFDALFPRKRDRAVEATRKCRGSNVEEGLRLLEAVEASHLHLYAMGLEPWIERITGPASTEGSSRMRAADLLTVQAKERGIEARKLTSPCDTILVT